MICENSFCIYWENDSCILDEVTLNSDGICESRIHVDIPESYLGKIREEQLEKIEKLDK